MNLTRYGIRFTRSYPKPGKAITPEFIYNKARRFDEAQMWKKSRYYLQTLDSGIKLVAIRQWNDSSLPKTALYFCLFVCMYVPEFQQERHQLLQQMIERLQKFKKFEAAGYIKRC